MRDSRAVQPQEFFAMANLLNLEVDLPFFDTTSTHFDRDAEDPTTPGGNGRRAGGRGVSPVRALQALPR